MTAIFIIIGFLIGMLGTIVGAGGGFILVPILMFLWPEKNTFQLTAVSSAVVFFNALSGTIAYALMKKIDFKRGLIFAVSALPGAYLGALSTHYLSRTVFDLIFAVMLVAISIFLAYRIWLAYRQVGHVNHHNTQAKLGIWGGVIISIFVGFMSNILGIGGGIIHVPALVYLLGFKVPIAAATSHFILAITSFVAVGEHMVQSSYTGLEWETLFLASGAIVGAQAGARISKYVNEKIIIFVLSLALFVVGVKIILGVIN